MPFTAFSAALCPHRPAEQAADRGATRRAGRAAEQGRGPCAADDKVEGRDHQRAGHGRGGRGHGDDDRANRAAGHRALDRLAVELVGRWQHIAHATQPVDRGGVGVEFQHLAIGQEVADNESIRRQSVRSHVSLLDERWPGSAA